MEMNYYSERERAALEQAALEQEKTEQAQEAFSDQPPHRSHHTRSPRILLCAVAGCAVIAVFAFGATQLSGAKKQETQQAADQLAQVQADQARQEAERAQAKAQAEAQAAAVAQAEIDARHARAESWELLVADPAAPLSADPELTLTRFTGSDQQVDSRIADALKAFTDASNAAGYPVAVTLGFRSYAKQNELFKKYVREQQALGYEQAEAEALAAKQCAAPGTSDHQTGLGVHLIADGCASMDADAYAATEACAWLTAHCAEYGFVVRYPADKEDATGLPREPWHFRYVGIENAAEMAQRSECLEEYVAYLKE